MFTKFPKTTLAAAALLAIGAPAALADEGHHEPPKPDGYASCWEDTVDAYAALVPAITVKGEDMNWGAIAICHDRKSPVTLTMNPENGYVSGGDKNVTPIDCIDRKAAKFEITGVKGCDFEYKVTAKDLEHETYKGKKITLDLTPYPNDGKGTFGEKGKKFDPCATDTKYVKVGGKLTIPADATCGIYKGSVTLTAWYK